MSILAGDIGGTNSRLAAFRDGDGGLEPCAQHTYPSADYSCVSEVISEFLASWDGVCEAVCLGLPGPVTPARVIQLTNLPWRVDRERLRRAAGTDKVEIINDVQASAAGVHRLRDSDVTRLHAAQPDPDGMRAVISVGTGLGVAGLEANGRTFATEAGHMTFSPRTDFDLELLATLREEYGHVSWERVASGPALPKIYAHIAPPGVAELDASEIVSRSAGDDGCRRAIMTFSRYLGAIAGDVALTMMATGGVYLCGGVAPRVVDACGADPLVQSFVDKGRMGAILERIPVYLVRDGNLALTGAAHVGARLLAGS